MSDNHGDGATGTRVDSLGQAFPTHDLESPERAAAVKTVESSLSKCSMETQASFCASNWHRNPLRKVLLSSSFHYEETEAQRG